MIQCRRLDRALLLFALVVPMDTCPAASEKARTALPRWADVSINHIGLCDHSSIRVVLGEKIPWQVNLPDDEFISHADYLNRDKSEVLMLIGRPGDSEDNCEMIVRKAVPTDLKDVALPLKRFQTGRGVRLGIKKNA
jgi:hypothetical protein